MTSFIAGHAPALSTPLGTFAECCRQRSTTEVVLGFPMMGCILHPGKLTCPLKRDYFNRKYIFQPSIFRGHVSFRECTPPLGYPRKLRINGDRINGWFHLPKKWGYIGVINALILNWDIQVSHHPVTPLKFKRMVHLQIIQGRKGKSSTRNLHDLGFQLFIIREVTVTSRIRHNISSRESRPKPYHCYWVGGGKDQNFRAHALKKSFLDSCGPLT